ncbi:extracellular solute-binding protein [Cohnella soli]|uniref:Extracellular solute-binding protein n=1 Tax=Cohnella soli TaxID=425005 RepID=A0ABW0HWM1_9BACL
MVSSKTKKLALSCVLALLPVMAACSNNGDKQATNSGTTAPTSTASASTPEETGNTNGKFDPPVTVTTVRGFDAASMLYDDETMDKNAIYDAYEKDFGIKIKNNWAVDAKEYNSKLKISIASNDLPDFFKVAAEDLPQLVDSDMVMDLSEAYEKYASEATKKLLNADGGKQMKSATFGGKLMAIPRTNSPFNGAGFVWLRKDWLKEMNLPEPKTMQDLLTISKAFATRDSGGKGKVFGLGLTKDIMEDATGFFSGFLNGYHAYPSQWVKDSSGKLVYGSIQPEMKTALKQLQDMYKAGELDPEAAVNRTDKMLEEVANDRLGMLYGAFWYSAALQEAVVKDGKVTQDWGVYTIPSIDGSPALTQISAGVNEYYVINKNAKNPDAIFKLLNQWVDVLTSGKAGEGEPNAVYANGKALKDVGKVSSWDVNPITVFIQDLYLQGGQKITKALQTNDPSEIAWSGDLLNRYNQVKQFEAGDTTVWYQMGIAGKDGTFTRMNEYFEQNRYHFNEFYGAATPTMGERGDLLKTKEQETFTRIVLGSASIDEFDKFVAEWKKLGGDKITEEVNEWYAKVN